MARDVQQVQETMNSPLRANRLQAADYLPHVTRGGLDSELTLKQSSGVALLWAGRSEAVPIAS